MLQSAKLVLLTGFSLLLLAAGCARNTPATQPQGQAASAAPAPALVQIASAKRGALSSQLSYSGNIQAKQQVSLVPKLGGRVVKVRVDMGSTVETGDVLVELDRDALEAQVAQAQAGLAATQAKLNGLEAGPRAEQMAQAEANLNAARARLDALKTGPMDEKVTEFKKRVEQAKNSLWAAQLQRDGVCGNVRNPQWMCDAENARVGQAYSAIDIAQALLDQLLAPPASDALAQVETAVEVAEQQLSLVQHPATTYDLQGARASVSQAKAAWDLAKLQLNEATIKAPFSGIISQRMVSEGAMAGPTSPLLTLISKDTEITINVEEDRLALLKAGQSAMVTASAYPGEQFRATVTIVAPSVDARNRTVQVRLAPEDSDGKLRDGMFAQVQLQLGGRDNALLVPSKAIVREDTKTVVYTVSQGKVHRKEVTVGPADGEQTEIVSGLTDGEQVVVSGASGLSDGQEVAIQ